MIKYREENNFARRVYISAKERIQMGLAENILFMVIGIILALLLVFIWLLFHKKKNLTLDYLFLNFLYRFLHVFETT